LSRGDLTEVEWRILKVLLPVERKSGKRGRGRPPKDNRNVINGILWRLRAVARCSGKVRQLELDLSTVPTMVRQRRLGERSRRSRRDHG
jgi:hypothetical protein